ncbi:uncharacterized protein BN736_01740 [Prevotella sp. CAG:617]|nr:uncharacterized protein BN736_01740 [Prevotella sp. CAG:617]
MKPIISFSQGGAAARSSIALVRMLLVCVSLWTCSLMMSAQTEEIFFKESFQNVNGLGSGVSALDTADLEHPSGWILDHVYAGPQCALIASGGSMTLPPVPELMGNALLYVTLWPWNNSSDEPCKLELSLSGGSMTLPPVPELMGNAVLNVSLFHWNEASYEPCKLELSQGESSTSNLEVGAGDEHFVKMYNVTPDTRITIRATHDVI